MKKLLILGIVFLLLTSLVSATFVQESNMLVLWQLDDTSGNLTDYFGNYNYTLSYGSPSGYANKTLASNAELNQYSLHLDLNDYFIGDDWDSLEGLANFSISLWYKTTANTTLFGKCSIPGCNAAPWKIDSGIGETTTRVGAACNYGTGILPIDGEIHHVGITYNSTSCILYLDGNRLKHINTTGIQGNGTANFIVGYAEADEKVGAKYVDDISIWNVSLTESEIQRIKQYGLKGYINYSVEYDPDIIEKENVNFTFNLNISNFSFNVSLIKANLIYNNTAYSLTKTNTTDFINFTTSIIIPSVDTPLENRSFYFNYTTNGITKSNTTVYYQTVRQIYIDGCGGVTNTTTLNITFKDEITSSILSSDFDAYFKVWEDNSELYRELVFNATSVNTYKFCIYPNTTIYYSDIIIQYTSSGYTTRDWIRNNYSLDNVTNFETLYLLSTANATAITMHVTDATDNAMPDVLIEAWYFDISTGNYSLVGTKTTNTEGETIFNLILATNYYKFKFYENGDLKKDTGKFQITATDLYFQLVEAEATKLARWLDIKSMTTTLSYSNSSRGLTYSWLAFSGSVNSICWNITTGNGTSFNSDCSISENTQFTYTLPNINESFFIKGYAVDVDNDRWTLDTLTVDLREVWRRIWGTEGIMLAWLIYVVISLAALSSPISGIIGAVFAFPLIYWFGLLPIGMVGIMGILFLAVLLISVMRRRMRG